MLDTVDVGTQDLNLYERSAGAEAVAQLRELAAPMEGARIVHVNATPYGGGVAEILRSEIPLLRDLGLLADWKLITGDQTFFSVTKAIHNGLQGAPRELTPAEEETYLTHSARNAQLLEEEYDLVVVHDPQPLPLLQLHGKGTARWVWRCHIDTSEPNLQVWDFLKPYLEGYDAAVFTLGSFAPPDVPVERVEIIPPAIDAERPLVTQVSRFDPWKDPLGVIAAYRLIKAEVPGLQLALAGSMALDDPEGWEIYRQIQESSKNDPQIHLFTNLTGVGNVEVNAFQRLSDVVIQKSIREGFGLVVSETLWKRTPIVAGRAGGIPLQVRGGVGGFLVDSVEECAAKTLWALQHPEEAREYGGKGHELVRERFLLTRLIADELRLYGSLLGRRLPHEPVAQAGLAGEERDPVCGMRVDPHKALQYQYRSESYHFCSESCREQFKATPEYFLRAMTFRA